MMFDVIENYGRKKEITYYLFYCYNGDIETGEKNYCTCDYLSKLIGLTENQIKDFIYYYNGCFLINNTNHVTFIYFYKKEDANIFLEYINNNWITIIKLRGK